ncbi:sensor histidine kinase [Lacisediminimonas profundi]|uniref:sensor histidine kinase n=1 Tax=Lacisediminimonas profundi TaxID=2603856 RepID=UPI00124B18E6|nr:HAMP domain-containing sensor histidine kinase [Lacisediminimonas profundi]
MRKFKFSSELWTIEDPPWFVVLALGLALAALGFGFRYLLDPWLGNRQAYAPAIAAVALAGWIGGWRTGLLTAVVGYVSANYFFDQPRHQFNFDEKELVAGIPYYLVTGLILYLGQRARSANRKLMVAMEVLRKIDARRARFLAVLAHEVANPLAAVRTGVDLLRHGGGDPRDSKQTLEILDRQINQVTRLIDDLLDISRIDQGKIQLRRQRISLDALLAEAAKLSDVFTAPRQQRVLLETIELGMVDVDPDRMTQVFINVLQNASKFSPEGGTISITGTRTPGWCHVCVRDWGEGIPAERLQDVFEPYVQIQTSTRRNEGMGLGLSVVKNLVVLHGGRVEIRSDGLGKGSELVVSLPTPED